MKLWFIRHAIAEEADRFEGPDLARPLSAGGRRKAKAIFGRLAGIRPAPDIVISSRAVRAQQTAKLFCRAFKVKGPVLMAELNPGASPRAIREVVAALPANINHAALFGHEPDFSTCISEWTANGKLDLLVKKCCVIELDVPSRGPARLTMLLPPDILAEAGT